MGIKSIDKVFYYLNFMERISSGQAWRAADFWRCWLPGAGWLAGWMESAVDHGHGN